MKTPFLPLRTAFFLAAAFISPLAAQEAAPVPTPVATHPAKPFLWKIEGPELKKPSYLFGTIHLSSPEMKDLHPAAEKAFTSADALFTEIPLDPAAQMALMPLLIRTDGKTLDLSLGEKLTAALDAELKAIQPELSSVPFQTMKTWVMSMTLPLLDSQLQGHKALDSILWDRAAKAEKKTDGIETAASQMGVFDKFSEAENVSMLAETLKQLKESREGGENPSADLLAAYLSGDEAKITAEMAKAERRIAEGVDPELGKRFMKLLLTDRDISMAATIDEKLKTAPDQVNFFAIGTGHLVGEISVVSHLAAKGYHITRIQD